MRVISVDNWAHSASGKKIALVHSENLFSASPNQALLIIGGVHGDEPEGVALATQLLEWAQAEYSKGKTFPHPWGIIPCLNPDGYAANERTNGHGVDLNRNYPARNWRPEAEKPRYNPGPGPGSEPEIQKLTQLILKIKPRVVVHCHSWKPCLVMTGPENFFPVQALHQASGYSIQDSIGYPTPGSLSQWAWFDNQIPVICIEEAEGISAEATWKRFGPAFRRIFTETW